MSPAVPECRKHPWLFIKNDTIPEGDHWLCLRGNTRPFTDRNITHQDVISLIEQGYELTQDDTDDIAMIMNMEEILSLWKHYPIRLRGDLLSSNRSYNLKYRSQLHKEECTLDSKLIESSVWDIEMISRYVDVSTILNNPQIPWCRTSMSWNRTVTLEHIPIIDPNGTLSGQEDDWIMDDMLDRSPINLCMPHINSHNIHMLARNNNITLADAVTILTRYRHHVDQSTEFWDELSRTLHVDDILKLNDIVQCNWSQTIWWNPSISPSNIDRLRILMDDPFRSLYYGCDLDNVAPHEWMKMTRDDEIGLSTHPRTLKHLDRMRYSDPIMKNIILNSDIDLIGEHIEDIHFIDLLLMRSDLTPKLLQIVQDNITGVSYDSCYYPEMEEACQLDPGTLIDLFPEKITALQMSYCRWLDITRLHEYDIECYPPRELFCSMDEVEDDMYFDILARNNKLTYSKVRDLLSREVITQQDIEENWSNIQYHVEVGDVPKFNLPICKRTMNQRINTNKNCSGSAVECALSLGMPDIITSYTSGLTIELADRLGINVVYSTLSIDQLCIRGLDQVDMKKMHHIPMRYRLLHELGHLECIRNSFMPMTFPERSMRSWIDVDVVTIA